MDCRYILPGDPRWHSPHGFMPARLSELIAASGRTVESLARESGVSERVIRSWVGGRHDPGNRNLASVAAALGMGPNELYEACNHFFTGDGAFRRLLERRGSETCA